jgi:hypothetical protein
MREELETDYLIVGAGAAGMAFTDELLTHSDATVTIVDRRHAPGWHWQDAYPFVRIHQPSAFYGVSSVPLGEERIDVVGTNAGFYELVGADEIRAYFERVMHRHFLPTGRSVFSELWLCRRSLLYRGDARVVEARERIKRYAVAAAMNIPKLLRASHTATVAARPVTTRRSSDSRPQTCTVSTHPPFAVRSTRATWRSASDGWMGGLGERRWAFQRPFGPRSRREFMQLLRLRKFQNVPG